MIESHLQMLMDELKLQQAYRGRDPERMRFSAEQMADLRLRAEFAAKGGLILEAVSKNEKIEITDVDLEGKYQELADQRGQTVEAIKGYFVKDNAVEELRARLLEEKSLDWLLERSKLVSEGTVPPMKSQFDVEGETAGG
jgi:trigger factor